MIRVQDVHGKAYFRIGVVFLVPRTRHAAAVWGRFEIVCRGRSHAAVAWRNPPSATRPLISFGRGLIELPSSRLHV